MPLLYYGIFQAPTCWSELPEKIWLKVVQNLKVKDVNNLHLVSRNLHQIANLHVNQKFKIGRNSPRDLSSLFQSSRIFQELEFESNCHDYSLFCPDKVEILDQFISFTGSHIKKFAIKAMKVDLMTVQKWLNLLPNLESLELSLVKTNKKWIDWDLKSAKIERVKIDECPAEIESLLYSLEQCAIKEVELKYRYMSGRGPEVIQTFLNAQKKNLRKLTIKVDFHLPNDLKDLRLEYLDFDSLCFDDVSLEFLRPQADLKFLKLNLHQFSNENFDSIWELRSLECLELQGLVRDGNCLNNLHRLQKLKRLKVSQLFSRNILDHLKFGVFNNLEELDANFDSASLESMREMKRIIPNLKKIVINFCLSGQVNAMLENLKNHEKLESVELENYLWELTTNQIFVCPHIKYLRAYIELRNKRIAERFARMFPNLESLQIYSVFETKPSLVKLLSELRHLKKLRLDSVFVLDADFVLQCVRDSGKKLKEIGDEVDERPKGRLIKITPGFEVWHESNSKTFILNFS